MANKIYRPGKTRKDRSSGAHERIIKNRLKRADWSRDPARNNGPERFKGGFPYSTCNGKRNKVV